MNRVVDRYRTEIRRLDTFLVNRSFVIVLLSVVMFQLLYRSIVSCLIVSAFHRITGRLKHSRSHPPLARRRKSQIRIDPVPPRVVGFVSAFPLHADNVSVGCLRRGGRRLVLFRSLRV